MGSNSLESPWYTQAAAFQAVACVYPRCIALYISSLDNTWQLWYYLELFDTVAMLST
jgi:hypothetical protein